jgi:hypothetical protein
VFEALETAPKFLAQLTLERVGLLRISWRALDGVQSCPPCAGGEKQLDIFAGYSEIERQSVAIGLADLLQCSAC